MASLAAPQVRAEDSNIFRYPLATEPPTLDPTLSTDEKSIKVLANLFEGLAQYDSSLIPRPAVAASWEVLEEGMRYVFHLRKDVLWSDGVPLTANDFTYSWRRLLEPATGAEYAYFLFDVDGAEDYNAGRIHDFSQVGIKAVDDWTLEVRLNKPAVYFPCVVTFVVTFPLRRDIVEAFGDDWATPENMVSNGPFLLKEWWHDYRLTLVPNPLFYGNPKPSVGAIRYQVVEDAMTELNLYEAGTLDVLEDFHQIAIPHYKGHPDFFRRNFLRGYYYGFNVRHKPFDDLRVRKAFALAVNRDEIVSTLHGGEIPTTSWIPPGMFGENRQIGLKFDPVRARALLAEAGYPEGQGFPPIEMSFNTREINRTVAENLQHQWKEVLGIRVDLNDMEWKVYLKELDLNPPPLFRLGWGADYPDPDNFMNLFTSYSGNNHTRWSNAEYDGIIRLAASEPDQEKRQALYDRAQRILLEEDVVIMPLFIDSLNKLIKPRVKGLEITAIDIPLLKSVRLDKLEAGPPTPANVPAPEKEKKP